MWLILLWLGIFILGYIIIYFSADIFLDNLKDLSSKFQISPFILGAIILGIDPEESIASILASINGLPYVAIGNVIGNSIISLTLCFSLPAFFYKLKLKTINQTYFWIIYISVGIILIGFLFWMGLLFVGVLSLIIYVIYLIINFKNYSKGKTTGININGDNLGIGEEGNEETEKSKRKIIFLTIISFLLIILGGEILIFSTEQLINLTGLSESIFGFIIIAFMTNVEELTLIIKGIKKGKVSLDISIGGMIGKIIWNLTLTFGISAILLLNIVFQLDLIWNWFILLISICIFNIIIKKKFIYWKEGLLMITLFIIFLIINFINL
ncbi:MAG: sodium:calcium antiporter [Candidatus Helarchaeota archaeon]